MKAGDTVGLTGGGREYHSLHLTWKDADGSIRIKHLTDTCDPRHARRILDAVNAPSGTSDALMAAVAARGPRCDGCGYWTFRPQYSVLPRTLLHLCPDCRPSRYRTTDRPIPADLLLRELADGPRRPV